MSEILYSPIFSVNTGSGYTEQTISSASIKIARIIKSIPERTISGVDVFISAAVKAPTYKVSIQKLINNVPSGVELASNTFDPVAGVLMSIPLNYKITTPEPLVAVLEYKSGTINLTHCATFIVGSGNTSKEDSIMILTNSWNVIKKAFPSIRIRYNECLDKCLLFTEIAGNYYKNINKEEGNRITAPFTRHVSHIAVSGTFIKDKTTTVFLYDAAGNLMESVAINNNELTISSSTEIQVPLSKSYEFTAGSKFYTTVNGGISVLTTSFIDETFRDNKIQNMVSVCSNQGIFSDNTLELVWVYPIFEGVRAPLFPQFTLT
jgi:hypothetical protein